MAQRRASRKNSESRVGDWERRRKKTRADKGWAVKRVRPSKKGVMQWTGTMLTVEMSLVFDFGQGLTVSGLAMWFVH